MHEGPWQLFVHHNIQAVNSTTCSIPTWPPLNEIGMVISIRAENRVKLSYRLLTFCVNVKT